MDAAQRPLMTPSSRFLEVKEADINIESADIPNLPIKQRGSFFICKFKLSLGEKVWNGMGFN